MPEWMTLIYNLLGTTVGCIQTGQLDDRSVAQPTPRISPTARAKSSASTSSATSFKRLQLGDTHRKSFEQAFLGTGTHAESETPVQAAPTTLQSWTRRTAS